MEGLWKCYWYGYGKVSYVQIMEGMEITNTFVSYKL